ncbi:Transposase-like protein [Mycena venus]|uniref:Transposase-like protein n=1 Tax=Mycena venus TaxID=2733690 RepID=A0A8H6X2S6_9AGAR|nr:Transposase-like protein [Mycena venus]
MSKRRLSRVCGKSLFTIFILGACRRSLPVLVTQETSMDEIYQHLEDLTLVPSTGPRYLYFSVKGRRTAWEDTVESLGIGPMSHLFLKIPVPGGADDGNAEGASSHTKRKRNAERMKAVLEAEDMDSDGNPVDGQVKKAPRKKRKVKAKATPADTDPEDLNFTSGESEDSDSEPDVVITNEELAESLPAKTAKASTRNKAPAGPVKMSANSKGKGKARAHPVPEHSPLEPPSTPVNVDASSPVAGPSKRAKKSSNRNADASSPVAGPSKRAKKSNNRNPIYHFYEKLTTNADSEEEEGTVYWKCWHGNRKTFKITEAMHHNTSKLQQHLRKHFKPLYRLYQVLYKRDSPPTSDELALAEGTKLMDDDIAAEYALKADQLNMNIKEMFAKQAAAAEEPWDQQHFEDLVAKWVAVCDQPFTAVNAPEFREMLQYAHRKPLDIPHDKSVKIRIQGMATDLKDALKQIFKENLSDFVLSLDAWTSSNGYAFLAIVVHYIGNDGKLEECLIDFRELVGQHSGENMAAAVWKTVEDFGLKGRVISPVLRDIVAEYKLDHCLRNG